MVRMSHFRFCPNVSATLPSRYTRSPCPLVTDAVRRPLLVKAEGITQYENKAVFIDLRGSADGQVEETVDVDFPNDAVPGSGRLTIAATGDLFGPVASNVGDLLRMPHGCGEQTMLNFAPNIYISDYLAATNQFLPDYKAKALKFMKSGYQRELTYQHKDGSFSAFGENDESGSMWLTAFVIKCFRQATGYIFIDLDMIEKSVLWILNKHNIETGMFPEPGEVHHKDMQGGSSKGVPLTAFTVIALLHNRDSVRETVKNQMVPVVAKSLDKLQDEIDEISEPYSLALITYALTMAGSSRAQQALRRLNTFAIQKDGLKYWQKEQSVVGVGSVDVEMTAYALLVYAHENDIEGGLPILKWLTRQRNSQGAFSSTQDTVVGLQAMAEFAAKIFSNSRSIQVSVASSTSSEQISHNFDKIQAGNALLYQKYQVPAIKESQDVIITATGRGSALVQVFWSYNIIGDVIEPSFNIESLTMEKTENHITVQTCVRYLKSGDSNMAVVELDMPSCFIPERSQVGNLPKQLNDLQRVEIVNGNTKVNLYYNQIGNEEKCVKVQAQRQCSVKGHQPASAQVFDYYNTGERAATAYTLELKVADDPDNGAPDKNSASGCQDIVKTLHIFYFLFFVKMFACLVRN